MGKKKPSRNLELSALQFHGIAFEFSSYAEQRADSGLSDGLKAAFRAAGSTHESVALSTVKNHFEVLDENWLAIELLDAIQTQWKRAEGVKFGYDYAGVDVVLNRRFKDESTAFELVQKCEALVLDAEHRMREAKSPS